jgi:hypothetical protein
MSRAAVFMAAAAASTLAAASAAQAATTVASEARSFEVSAHGDAIAWSSYDATAGTYRLMLRRRNQAQPLDVPASAQPFDVDLGTSTQGALVAVYSRAGRLYEWSSRTGAERPLGIAGREPTVLAGRLAFVRRVGGRDVLYLRRSPRARSARQFTAGTSRASGIGVPALSRTHLAFVTYGPGRYGFGGQHLRVQSLAGRSRVIYRATSGGANFANIVAPSFDGDGRHLFWARTNNGSGVGNRYLRRTLATGRQVAALGSSRICSTSWAGGTDGFATAIATSGFDCTANEGDGRVELQLTGPPRWR